MRSSTGRARAATSVVGYIFFAPWASLTWREKKGSRFSLRIYGEATENARSGHAENMINAFHPDILAYLFAAEKASYTSKPVHNLVKWKSVCIAWRDAARRVLMDWWFYVDDDEECNPEMRISLLHAFPLRCTLHPRVDERLYSSEGPNNNMPFPGHPNCSVVGTLHDLHVEKRGNTYKIVHMQLTVDGVPGVFESAWDAMATKFRITRKEMEGYFEWDGHAWGKWSAYSEKSELDFMVLGLLLRNGWLSFGHLHECLNDQAGWKRPNGSPVVSR